MLVSSVPGVRAAPVGCVVGGGDPRGAARGRGRGPTDKARPVGLDAVRPAAPEPACGAFWEAGRRPPQGRLGSGKGGRAGNARAAWRSSPDRLGAGRCLSPSCLSWPA